MQMVIRSLTTTAAGSRYWKSSPSPTCARRKKSRAYATKLHAILRYLDVNSGDMEKGVIRFEANVSVREAGSDQFNTRTEIKNLNSFRALMQGIEYEIKRQSEIYTSGGTVEQETLGFNEATGKTYSQRGKESAHDYRYFPEPDLPPLVLDAKLDRNPFAPACLNCPKQRQIASSNNMS